MLKTGCWSLIDAPGNGLEFPRLRREQGIQLARPVERSQIVVSADVRPADEDLRYRAPAGFLHHLLALLRVQIDADFLDVGDPFGLEQRLRAHAVRAHA